MNEGTLVLRLMVYRFRRLYVVFPVYLLLLIGLGQAPKDLFPGYVNGIFGTAFVLGLLLTVFGFVNVEADIAATTSAYSPWLLRMPVKTSTLALWPMLAASVWASVSWVVYAGLVCRPLGMDTPIWWPAAMFVTLALNFQAILWIPVRSGVVRSLVAVVLPMSIALFGLIAMAFGWSQQNVILVYLVIAVASACFAWNGLYIARTSLSSGNRRTVDTPAKREVVIRPMRDAFKSPQAAQFWLEWRRQGRILPIITTIALIGMSLPILWSHDTGYLPGNNTVQVNIWSTTAVWYLPWIPLLFATVIGIGARTSDLRGTDGVYHLYHATRPLSAEDLHRAKIRSITAGVLLTTLITIGTMTSWLCLPAMFNDGKSLPYVEQIIGSIHARDWLILVGMAVGFTAWTWRNQTVGAFADFLTARWLANTYAVWVIFCTIFLLLLFEALNHMAHDPDILRTYSIILGTIILVKIGIAIGFAAKILALRPQASREILKAFAYWAASAAVAAAIFGLIVYEMPTEAVFPGYRHPVPELLAVLLVPLARPFAARIALELGRHR